MSYEPVPVVTQTPSSVSSQPSPETSVHHWLVGGGGNGSGGEGGRGSAGGDTGNGSVKGWSTRELNSLPSAMMVPLRLSRYMPLPCLQQRPSPYESKMTNTKSPSGRLTVVL